MHTLRGRRFYNGAVLIPILVIGICNSLSKVIILKLLNTILLVSLQNLCDNRLFMCICILYILGFKTARILLIGFSPLMFELLHRLIN